MSLQVDEQRISAIVQKVVAELRQERPISSTQSPISNVQSPSGQDGVFPEIDSAIAAAQVAHQRLMALPVERRDVIISQMRQAARENAQVLAHEAWQETGMGRYEDKIEKNL
ncbi:MAG: aldehyde dehydrogenase EutE, partial [Anaerolineae bacterium]